MGKLGVKSWAACLRNSLMGSEADIIRRSYIWNMLAGMFNAGQSVLILITLTRTAGIEEAGIFTIAYAAASLFHTVGNYGMRSFQVTDASEQYRFSDYLGSRIVTCTVMVILSGLYVAYEHVHNGYYAYKIAVVLSVCLMRTVDAAEDVFTAFYQQRGRLDIGARITLTRQFLSVLSMCILLISGKTLLTASALAVAVSTAAFVLLNWSVRRIFPREKFVFSVRRIMKLLRNCVGPFTAGFLSFYLINAPKYAIDTYLPQELQAYYGFVSMPVWVVGLLNSFLYQPILPSLAADWNEGRFSVFIRRAVRQLFIIVAITLGVLVGAYLFGIPVLSLLYHADLRPYKVELLILLAGSGMLTIAGFVNILLTILRYQRDLTGGYMMAAVVAFFLAPLFVRRWGILGASWVYTILISGLALLFAGILVVRIGGEVRRIRQTLDMNFLWQDKETFHRSAD